MSKGRSARSTEEWRRDVALFRYALIRDAADPALSKAERGRLVRALAGREHVAPDGRVVQVARGTLDEWIRAYRRGGFEALVPRPRVVAPRTPAGVLELAFQLKRERPERTAAQVREIMLAAGGPAPGLRTLQTHLARAGLNVRADGRAPGKVYGRFEASVRNELWTGDGLHGPMLDGAARRAVLLALIDDHSRLLVGWRWGVGEDVFRLEAALRPGLLARGVPDAVLVDRGSAFVSSQLLRACAVLGVKLVHASPRAATTKGKIERFFRTVRDQFLVEIDGRDGLDLAELNRLFSAWLHMAVGLSRGSVDRPSRLVGGGGGCGSWLSGRRGRVRVRDVRSASYAGAGYPKTFVRRTVRRLRSSAARWRAGLLTSHSRTGCARVRRRRAVPAARNGMSERRMLVS